MASSLGLDDDVRCVHRHAALAVVTWPPAGCGAFHSVGSIAHLLTLFLDAGLLGRATTLPIEMKLVLLLIVTCPIVYRSVVIDDNS